MCIIWIYVADVHAHVERLVSVVKMANMIEEYTTERQRSLVLLWAKGLNAKDIHNVPCLLWEMCVA
jgi:hypothetical protein